jgi:hypothetical protein
MSLVNNIGRFLTKAGVVRSVKTGSSSSETATLRLKKWYDVIAPDLVYQVPTMLSHNERNLLYYLARDYFRGAGKIVDAGCFLGGSTVPLAVGLRDSGRQYPSPVIHTYDLFLLDAYMKQFVDGDRKPGDSCRKEFDRYTQPYREFVQVHHGDIQQIGWCGEPIEILFLDVLKSWRTNDSVVANFFPSLIPGRSVVIQQDYVHEFTPWIHITMEYLADFFEYLDFTDSCSTVYVLKKPLPKSLTSWSTEKALSIDEKVTLMDRAISKQGGTARGVLECSKSFLLGLLCGKERGLSHLQRIQAMYSLNPHIAGCAQSVSERLSYMK